MDPVNIAVIGGGSSYTPELVQGLIRRKGILDVGEIRLTDIDTGRLGVTGALTERMLKKAGLETKVRLLPSLAETLTGTDFVISQIRVGGLAARHLDETIPLKYGMLGQETTGIGGMMKGLRTIPVMLDIARKMEALAPGAWLINFTNPSGMITEAVMNHSTVKMAGLCNGPVNMLRQARALLPPEAEDFDYSFIGLNHLCWITELVSGGRDYLPELLRRGVQLEGLKNIPSVRYDSRLLRAMGGLPISYLNYFLFREEQIKKCRKAPLSRAQVCMETESKLMEKYSEPHRTEAPEELSLRGGAYYSEAAISLIESVVLKDGKTHVLDTRNRGAYPFLEEKDVVEVQCRVDGEGTTPLPYRAEVPPLIRTLMQTVKQYEKLAVDAALTGDREKALQAILIHPLGGDFKACSAALDELMEAHKAYLPAFFNENRS